MGKKIELNEIEQKIYDNYTSFRLGRESVWFDSGVRHIKFGPERFEDEKHADFYRRSLAKALAIMHGELNENS